MSRSFTLEERFIMALYHRPECHAEGDGVDESEVASDVGLSPKQLRAVCLQLAKANFIRRYNDGTVHLSDRGEELARDLLDE